MHNVAAACLRDHVFNRGLFPHRTRKNRLRCWPIDRLVGDDVSAKLVVRNNSGEPTGGGTQWLSKFGSFLDTQPPISSSDFLAKGISQHPSPHLTSQNFFVRPRTVAGTTFRT